MKQLLISLFFLLIHFSTYTQSLSPLPADAAFQFSATAKDYQTIIAIWHINEYDRDTESQTSICIAIVFILLRLNLLKHVLANLCGRLQTPLKIIQALGNCQCTKVN